jgi:hypothetical protein
VLHPLIALELARALQEDRLSAAARSRLNSAARSRSETAVEDELLLVPEVPIRRFGVRSDRHQRDEIAA